MRVVLCAQLRMPLTGYQCVSGANSRAERPYGTSLPGRGAARVTTWADAINPNGVGAGTTTETASSKPADETASRPAR